MCVKLYCMYVVEVFHPQAYDALIIMQDGWLKVYNGKSV